MDKQFIILYFRRTDTLPLVHQNDQGQVIIFTDSYEADKVARYITQEDEVVSAQSMIIERLHIYHHK